MKICLFPNSLFVFLIVFATSNSFSQNVGIGTNTPNPKAILDIKTTDKGVLFPMLTSAQREAITNPPDGLHIFNKDERCLNYYDSIYSSWNCYCEVDTCKTVLIHLTVNASNIDFYAAYADDYLWARKFSILIDPGVVIGGISFFNMPSNVVYKLKIINNGTLVGRGGNGGGGASGQIGSCSINAASGMQGSDAISTRMGLPIIVYNYGIVGGGGGGGGGGGKVSLGQYGGGGGGGAGFTSGTGGIGGGNTSSFINCNTTLSIAQNGTAGTATGGGSGGNGSSGGGNGGNGGGLGQTGQTGTGTSPGAGAASGKAIASIGGASGSVINNIGSGQTYGVVE